MAKGSTHPALIVHSPHYAHWSLRSSRTSTPPRLIAGFEAVTERFTQVGIPWEIIEAKLATRANLRLFHTPGYIDRITREYESTQWSGVRMDLARIAQLIVGGTLAAVDALIAGESMLAIHLPGGQHRALADRASDACIFNDFAIAAESIAKRDGKRVAILSIDPLYSSGLASTTSNNSRILTYSICANDFGQSTGVDIGRTAYCQRLELDAGDRELIDAVESFVLRAHNFDPELIFFVCSPAGHQAEFSQPLQYSTQGFAEAASTLASSFPAVPILMGGGASESASPLIFGMWSEVAIKLYQR